MTGFLLMTVNHWEPDEALPAVLILLGIMLEYFPDKEKEEIHSISENVDCSLPIQRRGSDKYYRSYSGT